jgi:hypothetical protein
MASLVKGHFAAIIARNTTAQIETPTGSSEIFEQVLAPPWFFQEMRARLAWLSTWMLKI